MTGAGPEGAPAGAATAPRVPEVRLPDCLTPAAAAVPGLILASCTLRGMLVRAKGCPAYRLDWAARPARWDCISPELRREGADTRLRPWGFTSTCRDTQPTCVVLCTTHRECVCASEKESENESVLSNFKSVHTCCVGCVCERDTERRAM